MGAADRARTGGRPGNVARLMIAACLSCQCLQPDRAGTAASPYREARLDGGLIDYDTPNVLFVLNGAEES